MGFAIFILNIYKHNCDQSYRHKYDNQIWKRAVIFVNAAISLLTNYGKAAVFKVSLIEGIKHHRHTHHNSKLKLAILENTQIHSVTKLMLQFWVISRRHK